MILSRHDLHCTIGAVQLALYDGHLAPVLPPEHHFTGLFERNQFMYANCSNFLKQSLFPLSHPAHHIHQHVVHFSKAGLLQFNSTVFTNIN